MNNRSKLNLAMLSHPVLGLNVSSQGWARVNHFLLCRKEAFGTVGEPGCLQAGLPKCEVQSLHKVSPKYSSL